MTHDILGSHPSFPGGASGRSSVPASSAARLERRVLALLTLSGADPALRALDLDAEGAVRPGPDVPSALAGRPVEALFDEPAAGTLRRWAARRVPADGTLLDATYLGGHRPRAVRVLVFPRPATGGIGLIVLPRARHPGPRSGSSRPASDAVTPGAGTAPAEDPAFDAMLGRCPTAALLVRDGVVRAANGAAHGLFGIDPAERALQEMVAAADVLVARDALAGALRGAARCVDLHIADAGALAAEGGEPTADERRRRVVRAEFCPVRAREADATLVLLRPLPAGASPAAAPAPARERPRDAETLARIVHDLTSPIAAARGYMQMASASRAEDAGVDRAEMLARACRALDRAARLAAGIRDLAREPEPAPPPFQPVDVAPLVDEAFAAHRAAAEARGIALSSEYDATVRLLADPDALARVIDNLVANAVAYNLPGGSVRVACVPGPQGFATLEIEDTGVGIAAVERAALFEPFRRGASAAGTSGSGLGLATVHAITTRHGATVHLAGAAGRGTRVVLRWPAVSLRPAPAP